MQLDILRLCPRKGFILGHFGSSYQDKLQNRRTIWGVDWPRHSIHVRAHEGGVKTSLVSAFHDNPVSSYVQWACWEVQWTIRDCAQSNHNRSIDLYIHIYLLIGRCLRSPQNLQFDLLYGHIVRGPMQIFNELWTNEECESEVRSSHHYAIELCDRLNEARKLAHDELFNARGKQKMYSNKRAKERRFKLGDKVLILMPKNTYQLLKQWRGPAQIISVVG